MVAALSASRTAAEGLVATVAAQPVIPRTRRRWRMSGSSRAGVRAARVQVGRLRNAALRATCCG
jgi:hypothetical protein